MFSGVLMELLAQSGKMYYMIITAAGRVDIY